jgi:hypothetical protein
MKPGMEDVVLTDFVSSQLSRGHDWGATHLLPSCLPAHRRISCCERIDFEHDLSRELLH